MSLKKTLFLTELYAPLFSGSANMFSNRFGLYPPDRVVVLTKEVDQAQHFDRTVSYPIRRVPLAWNGPKGFEWAGVTWGLIRAGFSEALRHRVEVIQCARPLPEGIAGYILAKLLCKKLVINFHGEDISVLQNYKVERMLMKMAIRAADLNLANSKFTETLIRNLGGAKARTAVIHPGFNPRPLEQIQPEIIQTIRARYGSGPILLTVGRLQRRKGQDHVIRALPTVIAQFPDLRYLIVGSSHGGTEDLNIALERLAEELGVRQHVVCIGEVPIEELRAYYAACDLFLMPARLEPGGDTEGFGIVFLEAGFLEKPVIGGNSGGIPDAIRHGENGLLVNGEQVNEIADGILQILLNPQRASEMGKRGKAFALTMTHERIFEQYRSLMISLGL